jgi:hypothetical protein
VRTNFSVTSAITSSLRARRAVLAAHSARPAVRALSRERAVLLVDPGAAPDR